MSWIGHLGSIIGTMFLYISSPLQAVWSLVFNNFLGNPTHSNTPLGFLFQTPTGQLLTVTTAGHAGASTASLVSTELIGSVVAFVVPGDPMASLLVIFGLAMAAFLVYLNALMVMRTVILIFCLTVMPLALPGRRWLSSRRSTVSQSPKLPSSPARSWHCASRGPSVVSGSLTSRR
ncbi:MAG TPA: hypothetical protein VMV09_02285 [Candidatus Saccharimonadales bacterium]|nr:hypothetical protein [Candidatus Saccharimonadales bacterium]